MKLYKKESYNAPKIEVDSYPISCIIGYLTNRPQFVRQKGSEKVVSSIGASHVYTLTVSLHPVYIRLAVHLKILSSPEILR